MIEAFLALENGTIFKGFSFGMEGNASGEVIFNTGMTGYQEIMTDPSYRGQIVLMTYPEIGNYGVNKEDIESWRPWISGFIVKEYWESPSNWRSNRSLGSLMAEHGVTGIWGVDTRMITRMIRKEGSMRGVISTSVNQKERLIEMARKVTPIEELDLIEEVSTKITQTWDVGEWSIERGYLDGEIYYESNGKHPQLAVIDCGVKRNILRMLVAHGFKVRVYPASTTIREVENSGADALFISNGPGDPRRASQVVHTVKEAMGRLPVFGICLGHQIMGLALGGETFKLKFGHHGVNQPVMDLETGKVEITSQNHNFSVDADSIKEKAVITHINLNDQTVEGIEIPDLRFLSVQYHPEGSPGPHDSRYIFRRFYDYLKT
jgi:carbamoyl-phosphate synthase small subunit